MGIWPGVPKEVPDRSGEEPGVPREPSSPHEPHGIPAEPPDKSE